MRKEIVTCDVCGAERKQANHWFVTINRDGNASYDLLHWPNGSEHAQAKHICGESCLHKVISEWAAKKD